MKTQGKQELTDLEKADCLTGTMMGGIALRSPHFGQGKRRRLIFEDRDCYYHTISRISGGDLLLGDVEKEAFRKLMRRRESFLCVEVQNYVVMGNHFHLLLRVPEREKFIAKFVKGTPDEREAIKYARHECYGLKHDFAASDRRNTLIIRMTRIAILLKSVPFTPGIT